MANEIDPRKARAYQANWGARGELRFGDIRALAASDLTGKADLAWGSFPCQDLSLAGAGAGLSGERSGTFYPFWRLMRGLIAERRAPRVIALENVCGALTSHQGRDFQTICETFADAGYRLGALVIDGALFIPQSRPRLFLIGAHEDAAIDRSPLSPEPTEPFHTPALLRAIERLDAATRANMVWWDLPRPPLRNLALADLFEDNPTSVAWHTAAQTERILDLMSAVNLAKVEAAGRSGLKTVGAVYRRTRRDVGGLRLQRAEVRFDEVCGCLRTPAGGSSRQTIMVVEGAKVRSRLVSARETARLMGLPDEYRLPANYNDAYRLTGDGVVVDVVRYLATHLIEPLLGRRPNLSEAA